MFSPSCRRSSPFSLTDLDMWDTKTRFTAQTSEWCGMGAVSGAGFLSRASTRSAGGVGQRDPGLQRWRSLSHLPPESVGRAWPPPGPELGRAWPPPGPELGAARGPRSFRQTEVVQWLQNAHERLDNELNQLWNRDLEMNYNSTTGRMLDMKTKLSKSMKGLEQEAATFSEIERSPRCDELHETSSFNKESPDEPNGPLAPKSLSRTEESPEDSNKLEKRKVDTELCKLRAALREAEARTASLEEERKKGIHQLQKSAETQKMLLNQIEEMNKKLVQTVQNHSDMQEQLSEANDKISQACLEKAVLSTQALKLEDNIRELKTKLSVALSEKDHLMQEKEELLQRAQVLELQLETTKHESLTDGESHQDQETVLMMEDLRALREVNERLRGEVDMIRQTLDQSQSQLKELTEERITSSRKISALEAQRSQLIREKEELLSKTHLGGGEVPEEPKEKCCSHRDSDDVLQVDVQKLQDQRLHLEAQVREKENMLQLQEEEYGNQDQKRARCIEELQAVASHWTEKWQKVALALKSTQDELEQVKNNSFTHVTESESESESLLRAELDTCKQELEQERRRNQALLQRYQDKGDMLVQALDKETVADWSGSALICEHPSDSQSCQNKSAQVWMQSSEIERLRAKLTEREKELGEIEHAFRSLERLREIEKTEAQIKISALEFELDKSVFKDGKDAGLQADVSSGASLQVQLDESKKRADQLQQEKMLAVQKLQTLRRQLCPVKDEKPSVEGKNDQTNHLVDPEAEERRRMVTEQLKSLFREREGKETGKVDDASSSAQSGAPPLQDWTSTPSAVRAAADRRNWQYGSGLMPVLEEDEEEEDQAEETHAEP
ncbi:coiled-coil domain-containing protein 102A-like isoform X1 [Cololabis saira]|uniref:coiled-coil domain-containing protein 102A-like isoform X1 n=1 Tax=Cololabis saira TaxID=129043 RepID=UPI002AD1DF42|nr:coiled-coil domain-containing protein 102A-like isoform X1 [Cololabis saira]